MGISGQLTWTRLPQGFKNSPTLFDEALHRDLADFRIQHPDLILLQYVDDLLLAATSELDCQQGTRALLQTLGNLGYRASAKKAQICQKQVKYLGYLLKEGQRWLTEARKETVMGQPTPKTPRQLREFLGTAGFCRLWIPGFAEMAAPLYPLTKTGTLFNWGPDQQKAYQEIKQALLTAPALGLPDLTKPFELFVDEKQGYAKGVLTQKLGPWRRPVAYLSKKLDPVAAGWPPCLRMVAAIAVLTKDAGKLTMGQPLVILAPHAVEALVKQPLSRISVIMDSTERVKLRQFCSLPVSIAAIFCAIPSKVCVAALFTCDILSVALSSHSLQPDFRPLLFRKFLALYLLYVCLQEHLA